MHLGSWSWGPSGASMDKGGRGSATGSTLEALQEVASHWGRRAGCGWCRALLPLLQRGGRDEDGRGGRWRGAAGSGGRDGCRGGHEVATAGQKRGQLSLGSAGGQSSARQKGDSVRRPCASPCVC